MSLASILLEGYNGYGNTDTINDPVSYLNEAAMECITGLYEASQQYYTDDIYGSASVLMEGSDAGSKLKEMWNKFVTAIKKVIDKFIEKIKNFVSAIRSRFSKQKSETEKVEKLIKSKTSSKIVVSTNATSQSKSPSHIPNDVMKAISDTNTVFDKACECIDDFCDANLGHMTEVLSGLIDDLSKTSADANDLMGDDADRMREVLNHYDEAREYYNNVANDGIDTFNRWFVKRTGTKLDNIQEITRETIQKFSDSVNDGVGTLDDAQKINDLFKPMDSKFTKLFKICDELSKKVAQTEKAVETSDIFKITEQAIRDVGGFTETDISKLMQLMMWDVNSSIKSVSLVINGIFKVYTSYSSYSREIQLSLVPKMILR